MFDEPINGLDPDGILWIRNLMRSLAAEGRTVFLSSHLMSEMAQTADHLLVIGRGRIIADASTEEFVNRDSAPSIRVRAIEQGDFATRSTARRPSSAAPTAAWWSPESTPPRRRAASANGSPFELVPQVCSLEEAYFDSPKMRPTTTPASSTGSTKGN